MRWWVAKARSSDSHSWTEGRGGKGKGEGRRERGKRRGGVKEEGGKEGMEWGGKGTGVIGAPYSFCL